MRAGPSGGRTRPPQARCPAALRAVLTAGEAAPRRRWGRWWRAARRAGLPPPAQKVVDELHLNSSVKFPKNMRSSRFDSYSKLSHFPDLGRHPEYAHLHYPPYHTRPLLASRRTSAEGTGMHQYALNGSSRLRETLRAPPLAHPTTSRPKPEARVAHVASGAPPPHEGPWGGLEFSSGQAADHLKA